MITQPFPTITVGIIWKSRVKGMDDYQYLMGFDGAKTIQPGLHMNSFNDLLLLLRNVLWS